MAYVAPRTWTTGELVTAAMMNQDVRDNITYLKTQTDLLYTVTHAEPVRAINVIYQNSTKIRIVTVNLGFATAAARSANFQIGAGTPPATQVYIITNAAAQPTFNMAATAVVPANWYYRVLTTNAPTLVDWHEWDLF